MTDHRQRSRFFKREALRTLFCSYFNIAAAFLFLFFLLAANSLLRDSCAGLFRSPVAGGAAALLADVLFAMICVPFACGVIRHAMMLYLGKGEGLGGVFHYFNDRTGLKTTYRLFWMFFWRTALFLIGYHYAVRLILMLCGDLPALSDSVYTAVFLVLSAAVMILSPFFFFLYMQKYVFLLFLIIRLEKTDFAALKRFGKKTGEDFRRGKYRYGLWKLTLSFFAWFLLSAFSLGVLLFAFVLPYVTLSLISYCDNLYALNREKIMELLIL